MSQAVGAVFPFFEACLHHCLSNGHLHGAIAHWFSGYPTLKKVHFWTIGFVVAIQVDKQVLGQDGHPVFLSFSLFYLHRGIFGVDAGHLQVAHFFKSKPCAIKHGQYAAVLGIHGNI